MRELPPPDPYPVDALGDMLAPAARAIHDRIQAPLAICGQSVLAAATLATQALADIELPMGHARPLSSYYVTVAATGERKSAADQEALWAVRQREAALRERYAADALAHRNASEAWEEARRAAIKPLKGDREAIKAALDAIGPTPAAPLVPVLTCPEPTYEGLCRLLATGWPSIGVFAGEGGQFIGGHGMADDARLRTTGSALGGMGRRADPARARHRWCDGTAGPARLYAFDGAAQCGRGLDRRSAAHRPGPHVARAGDRPRASERHASVA
jgi:hypothetical protein